MKRVFAVRCRWDLPAWAVCASLLLGACSSDSGDSEGNMGSLDEKSGPTNLGTGGSSSKITILDGMGGEVRLTPEEIKGGLGPENQELWYASNGQLVMIQLDDVGSFVSTVESELTGLPPAQNSLTMLENGDLLGARDGVDTLFYLIEDPPRDTARVVAPKMLGELEGIRIEALYTDCEGRIFGMDTGVDVGSAVGNRLLYFTGDVLGGDFSFDVVSDLASADVADIDDMGPGIDEDGKITDNPGFAIDTGSVHDFNYETGSGTPLARGGTWGIHVLGGDLFADDVSRLYVLDRDARLFELDHKTSTLSDMLVQGPQMTGGHADGHSGLTGPLTNCVSGFKTLLPPR